MYIYNYKYNYILYLYIRIMYVHTYIRRGVASMMPGLLLFSPASPVCRLLAYSKLTFACSACSGFASAARSAATTNRHVVALVFV